MKFKDMHPDYQNYTSESYIIDRIPRDFFDAFQGLITKTADSTEEYSTAILRRACDITANNIPTKQTTNTGRAWLVDDLDSFVKKLGKKNFPKIMDTIGEVAGGIEMDIDELNEMFEDLSFGYHLSLDRYDSAIWTITDEAESAVEAIEEGLNEVAAEQINVIEHLNQAKRQMQNISEARSRKDALRDCASALEAQLKYYTKKTKIDDAVKSIKTADNNVPRKIIDDAKTIWDRIHQETPDVRHGSAITSDLSEAEALYWIDRIMALIKYLARELED